MICPNCEQDEGFEKRGTMRRYYRIYDEDNLAENAEDLDCDNGDEDIDIDGRGNEIIYCLNCGAQLTAQEIRAANEEPKAAVAYVEVDPQKTVVLVNRPGKATRVRLP